MRGMSSARRPARSTPSPGQACSRRSAPWPAAGLLLAIALAAFLTRVIPTPRTIDDAFITFRYARNLTAGAGFVCNSGERVLGATTPLFTVVLAGLARLTGQENYPWLALLVNSATDAAACAAWRG
jgi:hypothetical protein